MKGSSLLPIHGYRFIFNIMGDSTRMVELGQETRALPPGEIRIAQQASTGGGVGV